jgi:hypothetical protein
MWKLRGVETIQTHAGTAAPFNFNGLVRHYFLRESPTGRPAGQPDAESQDRERSSHEIALDLRERSPRPPARRHQPEVVEPPPGPPVMATLLAEIYGPDAGNPARGCGIVEQAFRSTDFIVDVDNSIGDPAPRLTG